LKNEANGPDVVIEGLTVPKYVLRGFDPIAIYPKSISIQILDRLEKLYLHSTISNNWMKLPGSE
jgi:hypothetical protein